MASTLSTSPATDFDGEFIRAVLAGDGGAFARMVDAFTPGLRRMAMRYFRSPFDQEEALQEVFVQLHRKRDALDPARANELRAFVFTLARRRMIDLARSRGLEPVAEDLTDEHWQEDGHAQQVERVHQQQLAAVLEAFAARLKPAYQPFFRAVFVEGRDVDEARRTLGMGRLRARYLKKVLLTRLRQHRPLLDALATEELGG